MQKIFDAVAKTVETICKIMLLVQVISVMCVVIGRYIFNVTPAWGEELTLFCLVWVSLVGAMIPLRENTHIRMTVFDPKLPKPILKVLDIFSELIILVFSVSLLVAGSMLTSQSWKTILHGIKISRGFLYAAVPVSMGLFIWILFEKKWSIFSAKKQKDKE